MLKQKFALDFVIQVFLQIIAIISGIIVARVGGPSVVGILAFGLSFASTFRFISDPGLEVAHIKLISAGEDLGKCNSTFTIMKIVSTGLFLFFTFAIFLSQKYLFSFNFESKTQEYVLLIFILIVALSSLSQIPIMTFTARMEITKKNIPILLQGLGENIAKVILIILGFRALAISLSSLSVSIVGGIFLIFLFKNYPFSIFDKELAKKYLKITFPILGIVIISIIIANIDKVILQFLTSSEELGYYVAGYKISFFIMLIGISFGNLFFPLASGYIGNKNYLGIKDKINSFEKFVYLFVMPMVIFMAIYSPVIVKVFLGNKYMPSVNILSIMTIAAFILLITQPYRTILFSGGFFKESTLLNLYGLIIFIIMEYIFVSQRYLNLGALGAALAAFTLNIFLFIIFKASTIKKIPQLKMQSNLEYMGYGIANFIIFYFTYTYFSIHSGNIFKFMFPLCYFSITYISLYLCRLLKKSDFLALKDFINIKAMSNYVKDEFFDSKTVSLG